MSLALITGARPNFVKVAPIARELDARGIAYTLIHTGQHYDLGMSRGFRESLAGIGLRRPDHDLGVSAGSRVQRLAGTVQELAEVFSASRPKLVIVVGDVDSTLAGALCASGMGIPVAHVEAGMRSFDRSMPEELNRVLTDLLSELLFTSCEDAGENLAREVACAGRVFFVGNVMIDTLVALLPEIESSTILSELGLRRGEYAYMTLHRPGNVDDREKLAGIAVALDAVGSMGLRVVFPAHPRTRRRMEEFTLTKEFTEARDLVLLEPLGYVESMAAVRSARFVLTDSGGLQEETTFLGVPCLTLRPNTERPITVRLGTNTLLDAGPAAIPAAVAALLEKGARPGEVLPLWDGKTAERIVDVLEDYLC